MSDSKRWRGWPMGRLARFHARPPEEQWLFLEAALRLAIARLTIRLMPFRWIAPRLGRQWALAAGDAVDEAEEVVRRVAWAVAAAARHLPWESVCLPQAMAAKAMLSRRGIGSTLYLGLVNDGEMRAHAWVRVGSRPVTGGSGDGYTVVSSFT